MSTYISSKKIIFKVINLTLLLSTTHVALINPVLADFEDSIDQEEKVSDVRPEDLSQDLEEIQKKGAQVLERGAQVGAHVVEVVQNMINVEEIRKQRDDALRLLTIEKKSGEEFQKKVTQLEAELSEQRSKLNDKKSKVSQLKTNLNEKNYNITSLNNQNKTLLTKNDQQKEEIEALKSKQEKTKQDLLNKKLEFENFKNGIIQNLPIAQTAFDELKNALAEKERLLNSQEERISQLTQDLTGAQQNYKVMQDDMVALKENHKKEKKTLSDGHLTELDKMQNVIAEKEQLLSNQQQIIDKLEQDQYNRLEQDRDWSDIRSYFEQQEVNELKTELSKESDTKIEQLNINHQAEKTLLEEQINNLRTEYNSILTQTDKSLADITEDLTRRLNLAESLSQKSAKDLFETQSELTKITQENRSKELVIASLEKKLMENARELANSLNVNDKSSDKIKELENDKNSLEKSLNRLLSEQNQNLSQIQELEEKLLSEQEKHNNYTQQIAQLTEQNRIAKESLAQQILLQGQTNQRIDNNNDVQELEIFSQSRDLELNDVPSISSQEVSPQTINVVTSITSVMTNSIEAASNQLYDNINSRFNWNDHISSGEERGQMEIWVKQGVGVMNQKPTEASKDGYKGRNHGLFIGIDHECELGDKNLIGAAIALNNKSKMQLRGSHAQLITDSNMLSVYGKRYLNSQLAVSGAFSYFRGTTEANNFGENIDKIKTHGTKFDLELSYNKLVSSNQSWQPFVGVSYSTFSAFDVNFKDQSLLVKMKKSRLLSGKIGTRVQLKQYNLENGINISPSLMASISKPLKIMAGNRCVVNNSILSDKNNSVLTHKIKDATLNLSGDLRINRNNIDIIASYNFSIRKKYQAHQGGVKLEVKL